MSRFEAMTVACPKCAAPVRFAAVTSVNADRRPDLRDGVLDGSFQREACRSCGSSFRLDPEMSYVDLGRGTWTAVHAAAEVARWKQHEADAKAAFDLAYGRKASDTAKEMGAALRPRVVFGWAALREKLVVQENKLDDVELELTKSAIVRGRDGPAPGAGVELRLMEVQAAALVFAWIDAKSEQVVEMLSVPRSLYDEIAADKKGWKALRGDLSGGYFVDMMRMVVAGA
jgi:hypothetical protein